MARSLHIVLLDYRDVTHPEAGGAETYLNELFQRIAGHGHRVTLICARHRGAPTRDRIGRIDVVRTGNKATMNFVGARAALSLARREPVDLFVENICKIPFALPLLTRIPVLPVVMHLFGGIVFQEVNPAFASYVWMYEQFLPYAYRGVRCVTISASTADDLNRRGLCAAHADIVNPGLHLERYRAPEGATRSSYPLVVYLGMLKRYKGLDTVIRAFARVRAEIPAARLAIIGKGNDRPRLEKLVTTLGLGHAVSFEGFASEAAKVAWLHRAHVVISPSLKEGWGIPVIEAAACDAPVVASDTHGLRDAVRHGATGFLVPHDDVDAWARRMVELLVDHELRTRMGAAGREWAGTLGWDGQAEKMLRVVQEVARGIRREEAPAGQPDE